MKLWEERLLNGARELPYNMPPGMASAVGRGTGKTQGFNGQHAQRGGHETKKSVAICCITDPPVWFLHVYIYTYVNHVYIEYDIYVLFIVLRMYVSEGCSFPGICEYICLDFSTMLGFSNRALWQDWSSWTSNDGMFRSSLRGGTP